MRGEPKIGSPRAWETYLTDEILLDRFTVSPGIRYTSVEYEYKGAKRSVNDVLAGWAEPMNLGSAFAVCRGAPGTRLTRLQCSHKKLV